MASSVLHTQQKLPPGSNFSDSFWDDQNKGVEIIMSRLRKSKDTCEEIKKLYELRASIEQDYGERLLKLAQSSRVGDFEEDSFAETLSRIPSALETTARAHIDLAQQLKDHLEAPLDGFLKDQRDVRKMQQQQIENSKQLKKLHEADVTRAREYYSNECTKLNSMEQYYFNLGNDSSKEELIKIEKEIEEQRRMVAVADQVYRRSVDNFNAVNERWVNDWTSSADQFQDMEIKRISYLRSTLWSFANMMTSTFSIDEECCDRIRTALEITDVQKDITGFVQRYGTGTRIPAPHTYELLHQQNHIPLTKQASSSIVPEVTIAATAAAVGATATAAAVAASSSHNDNERDFDNQQPLSAPIPQTALDSLPETTIRGVSESNAASVKKLPPQPVTVLTNPDEELKSVDRQLQQLEVLNTTPLSDDKHSFMQTSPQQMTSQEPILSDIEEKRELENKVEDQPPMSAPPLSGVTNTTDQSTGGPVSNAFKEVEQILNQKSFNEIVSPSNNEDNLSAPKTRNVVSNRASYASNNQTIPPIMMARSTYSDAPASPPIAHNESDDFSAGIYDALGIKHTSQNDLSKKSTSINNDVPPVLLASLSSDSNVMNRGDSLSNTSESKTANKYKPMPNPIYNSNNEDHQLNKDAKIDNKMTNGTNEMANAAPETVPNQRPLVGTRTSSLLLSNNREKEAHEGNKSSALNQAVVSSGDDDDESEEDKEYHSRMPRPPPKDEKWVISSIRRPQQLPVRTLNARMFDGTTAASRNSVASVSSPPVQTAEISSAIPQQQQQQQQQQQPIPENSPPVEETDEHRHPKVHRPVIPLTIDIPNSVKPTPDLPQNAAQQVIAEGRRLSQMSPIQPKLDLNNTPYNEQQAVDRNMIRGYMNQNGLEDGGIRPAPWQEEMSTEDRISKNNNYRGTPTPNTNSYYGNGHHSYQPGMPGPRGSSLKLSNPELHHQHQNQMQQQQQQQMLLQQQQPFEDENKKKFGKNNGKPYNESSVKSKEKDNKGRFSLGFFTGNKKEKKKEKEKEKEKEREAAAAAAAAASAVATSGLYQTSPPEQHPQQYMMQQQQQQYMMQQQQQQQQQQRPTSQQAMYPQELIQSDLKSNHSSNNQPESASQQQQQQQQQPSSAAPTSQPLEGSRFVEYVKAQWPFEATINGEMSFYAEEVLGVIRKQTDGWWEAERLEPAVAGQRGLVPGNYMVEVTHPSS